jgi:hypothetical protein
MFPIAPQFIPPPLPKVETLTTYRWEPKGSTSITIIWECPKLSNFFCDGPIKVVSIAEREKEKKTLRCLHLTTKK